jgi:hypothetical protein
MRRITAPLGLATLVLDILALEIAAREHDDKAYSAHDLQGH